MAVRNSKPSTFKRFYPGIKTRLTLPFLIIILAVGGIAIFTATRLVAGSIEERIANQLKDSAQSISRSTVEIERQYIAALRLIAFTDGIPETVAENNTIDLEELMSGIVANESLDDTIIFNAEGEILLRFTLQHSIDSSTLSLPEITSWQSVQRVISGQVDVLGDKFVEIQIVDGESIIYFSAPIYQSNVLVGGILVGIRAQHFVEVVKAQSLSDATIYTSDGTMLGSTLVRNIDVDRVPVTEIQRLSNVVNSALQITDRVVDDLEYEVLYAPLIIREEHLGVIEVALQTDFVVDQISVSRNSIAFLFTLLIISIGGIGVAISRSITNPVSKMVKTTRLIQLGDLRQRVNLDMPDELGELAQSFDSMTEKLIRRNQRIKKMYKHQLRENAQRDAVLSSIGDAVIVVNKAGKNVLSNETAKSLINEISHNPTENQNFEQLVHSPKELYTAQTITFCEKHFSALSTPVVLRSGYVVGHVIVLRDITEIIEAEKLKDELIMQLSHELRTPLSAAIGYIQLVQMFSAETLSEQSKGFVDHSLDHLNILSDMINQVISVSSMLSGDLEIHMEDTDLAVVVEEAVKSQLEFAAQSEIEVIFQRPTVQLCVEANPERLREAIAEIINNAIAYTLPGGTVDVVIGQHRKHHVVQITDTGVGIPRRQRKKVFERLYRGDSADAGQTDVRGLGVGLFIAKTIVDAHDGKIRLQSQVGKGTRIKVAIRQKKIEYDRNLQPR